MSGRKPSTQIVLDAVHDLHALEQVVTREALQEVTGLKLTIVDDRIAKLVDDGVVLRKNRGVFVPAVQHPPARPISKTVMPDGSVKIEIGDEVLELTPKEDRTLAAIQSGTALQFAAIDLGQHTLQQVGALKLRIRQLEIEAEAQNDEGNAS